jgi:hypothetical protein
MTMHLVGALLTWYANVNRDTKRKPAPFEVTDFLPNPFAPSRQEREAAYARNMAAFRAINAERKH